MGGVQRQACSCTPSLPRQNWNFVGGQRVVRSHFPNSLEAHGGCAKAFWPERYRWKSAGVSLSGGMAVSPARAQPPSLTLLARPPAKEGGRGRGLSHWTRTSHELRPSCWRQSPVCLRHNTGPLLPSAGQSSGPRAVEQGAIESSGEADCPQAAPRTPQGAGAYCTGPRCCPGPFPQDPLSRGSETQTVALLTPTSGSRSRHAQI